MGGAASKYKVHPGRDDGESRRNKAMLDKNNASASVVTMLQKDAAVSKFYREKDAAVSAIGMTEDEKQAVATIEDLATKRSGAWLEAINTAPAPKPFKDPELMFLTRPQRLRLVRSPACSPARSLARSLARACCLLACARSLAQKKNSLTIYTPLRRSTS
eukprot:COSAG06_NODE_167_length_21546_cov_35.001352_8_plen_160_part_00